MPKNKKSPTDIKPWAYSPHYKDEAEGHIFMEKEGACTITLVGAGSMTQEELDGHGALIAAAPELLSSLKMLMDYINTDDMRSLDLRKASAAITKAEGRYE